LKNPQDKTRCRPIPRDELIEAYVSGTPLDALRKRYGVCLRRLWRILERRGVPRRSCREARLEQGRQGRAKPPPDTIKGISVAVLKEAYLAGSSAPTLSKLYGLSTSTIFRYLRLHGVVTRTTGQARKINWSLLPKEEVMARMVALRAAKGRQPAPESGEPPSVQQ
jgi:Mor family transcriptional regulator